jgi:hypothetical protein
MVATASASKWRMGFNPYPANVDKMAATASVANGGWDLIRRLKG